MSVFQVATPTGNYPNLGAGYLAKNIQVIAGANTAGWWKIGSIDVSKRGSTGSTSTILLCTGLYSHGQYSGIVEVNGRMQNGELNITASPLYLIAGGLPTDSLCLGYDGTVITLYQKLSVQYARCSWTILEDSIEVTSNVDYFELGTSFYGTTAPSGAVYAVVRNNASFAESAGYLAKCGQANVQSSDTVGWHKFASVPLASLTSITGASSYSCIILVNGTNPYAGSTPLSFTGEIEIDIRVDSSQFSIPPQIKAISGYININNICYVKNTNSIDLYIYLSAVYDRYVFTVEDERYYEGQILNAIEFNDTYYGTSAPSGAVYAVVRNIASKSIETSNNLLLNGTFQLNTQGETIYQSGEPYNTDYFVDGWRMIESPTRTGTVEVIDGGGVKVTGTGASFGIRQTLDTPMAGRTVTGTIKVSNKTGDSILYLYLWNTAYNTHAAYIAIQTDGTYTVTYTIPSDETNSFEFYISYASDGWVGQTSCIIEWAKLEEGTVSTAPNGLVQNATEALYAKAIPVASQTVFGGAKMWVDGGKLYIKTE